MLLLPELAVLAFAFSRTRRLCVWVTGVITEVVHL
jgi:hypothetical protein